MRPAKGANSATAMVADAEFKQGDARNREKSDRLIVLVKAGNLSEGTRWREGAEE
jgi:hypothetical protein